MAVLLLQLRYMQENAKVKAITQELANKYKLDIKVVNSIINHPFIYFKSRVRDPFNTAALRIPYLGVFYYRRNIKQKHELIARRLETLLSKRESLLLFILNKYNIEYTEDTWKDVIKDIAYTNPELFSIIHTDVNNLKYSIKNIT